MESEVEIQKKRGQPRPKGERGNKEWEDHKILQNNSLNASIQNIICIMKR